MIPNSQYMPSTTLLHDKWQMDLNLCWWCLLLPKDLVEVLGAVAQACPNKRASIIRQVMVYNGIQWYILRVIAVLYSFKRAIRRSSSKTITSISGMRCFGPWCHYAFEEFAKLQMNCPAKPPTLIKEALPDLQSLCFLFPSCIVMDAWFLYSLRLTLWHLIIHVLLHRILWHVWIQKFLQSCSSNSHATSCNKKPPWK